MTSSAPRAPTNVHRPRPRKQAGPPPRRRAVWTKWRARSREGSPLCCRIRQQSRPSRPRARSSRSSTGRSPRSLAKYRRCKPASRESAGWMRRSPRRRKRCAALKMTASPPTNGRNGSALRSTRCPPGSPSCEVRSHLLTARPRSRRSHVCSIEQTLSNRQQLLPKSGKRPR